MKIIIVVLFSIFFWANPGYAQKENYCQYLYSELKTDNALLCARERLSAEQLGILSAHIQKTYRLYPQFIKKYGIKFPTMPTKMVGIVIISLDEMNDSRLFKDHHYKTNRVRARYVPEAMIIYITKDTFELSNTDLYHEMIHYLNEQNGINDVDMDEAIAYAFEAYIIR